jgi:hypothetical protein
MGIFEQGQSVGIQKRNITKYNQYRIWGYSHQRLLLSYSLLAKAFHIR